MMPWRPCLASSSKSFWAGCYLATVLLTTSLALAFLAPAFLQEEPWQDRQDTTDVLSSDSILPGRKMPPGASRQYSFFPPASKQAAASSRLPASSRKGHAASSRVLATSSKEPLASNRVSAVSSHSKPRAGASLQTGKTHQANASLQFSLLAGESLPASKSRRDPCLWTAATAAVTVPLRHGFELLQVLSQRALLVLGVATKGRRKLEILPRVACEPESLQVVTAHLSALHHFYRRGDPAVVFAHPIPKVIHQTHSRNVSGFEKGSMAEWDSMHTNYEHVVWSDNSAREFVKRCVPDALPLYDAAPAGILRSDMLRYLLLLVFGGIWGDADTMPLRVYHDWLDGVKGSPDLSDVRLIAAVESDSKDWERKKFVRPVQVVQWTMAAAPKHPVVRTVVRQMLRNVAGLVQEVYSVRGELESESSREHRGMLGRNGNWGLKRQRQGEESLGKMLAMGTIGPIRLPAPGAVLTRNVTKRDVLQATGPGAWTDGISWGLKEREATMSDLVGMEKGKTYGDMVILPITAFSPGFGQGKSSHDKEARVRHWFVGSWKDGVSDE